MKIPTEMRKCDVTDWVEELFLLGWVVDLVLGWVVDVVLGWLVDVVWGWVVDVVWGRVVDVVGSSTVILNDLMTLYPLTMPAT